MTDNFFFFQPWVGLVLSAMGVLYIVFSIRYTNNNPIALSVTKNTRLTKALDFLFFNENQIAQLNLAIHAEWQSPLHLVSDNEQRMIQHLVKETIQKHRRIDYE